MRSFGQGMSPQTALWESNHEAKLANEIRERIRQELDAQEAEALATRHAAERHARQRDPRVAVATGR